LAARTRRFRRLFFKEDVRKKRNGRRAGNDEGQGRAPLAKATVIWQCVGSDDFATKPPQSGDVIALLDATPFGQETKNDHA
jgi:hypothetical protein